MARRKTFNQAAQMGVDYVLEIPHLLMHRLKRKTEEEDVGAEELLGFSAGLSSQMLCTLVELAIRERGEAYARDILDQWGVSASECLSLHLDQEVSVTIRLGGR